MKLPAINVPAVGRYHAKNLPRPNVAAEGKALGRLAGTVMDFIDADTDITTATGEAAKELSELRAKLETSNTVPAEEVPEGIEWASTKTVTDDKGEEFEVDLPYAYTHEIADQWWDEQSSAIVDKYAAGIRNKTAREKFINEVTERYVAPGSLAIGKASIIRKRSHNWANAVGAVNEVIASSGPTAQRESQAKEILARQLLLGADPTMVAQTVATIGPRIDQIDARNALMAATSADAIDQIEEEMWAAGNRMSNTTRASLSVEADKRRKDFQDQHANFQRENADVMFAALYRDELTLKQVENAVSTDQITSEKAQVMYNSLKTGNKSAKASNEFTLSYWRGEIVKLPYTGGQTRVQEKALHLKNSIQMAAMGLNPNGTPTGLPPLISGTDVQILIKDIDDQVARTVEDLGYVNAWGLVKEHTRIAINPITGALIGNQAQREAAILFKIALDSYMDQYGIDAKPVEFFQANKGLFDPADFQRGVDKKFHDDFPGVRPFITDENGELIDFNSGRQDAFLKWLRAGFQDGTINSEDAYEMSAVFKAYYRGEGIAPGDGELMLEPDHPIYGQFR